MSYRDKIPTRRAAIDFLAGTTALAAVFAIGLISSLTKADDLGGNDAFALDEITQHGLERAVSGETHLSRRWRFRSILG